MKSFKIFLLFLTLGLTSITFTACNEEQENEVDGVGSNFIRLPDAEPALWWSVLMPNQE